MTSYRRQDARSYKAIVQQEHAYNKQNRATSALHKHDLRGKNTKKERSAQGYNSCESSIGYIVRNSRDFCTLYIIRICEVEGGQCKNIFCFCQPSTSRR